MNTDLIPSPAQDRLRWLLDFVSRDISALRPGEFLDLSVDLAQALGVNDEGSVPSAARRRRGVPSPPNLVRVIQDRARLARLQQVVRAGLLSLAEKGQWAVFGSTAIERPGSIEKVRPDPPAWSLVAGPNGTIARQYTGSVETRLVAAAADLIERFWSELRRCAYAPCGAFFLPEHGRQRYHEPRCSSLERWHRHKPKRDYTAEKVRRVLGRTTKRRRK